MIVYYINLVLFFISLFLLIYFKYNKNNNYALLFKFLTSTLFISTGIISYLNSSRNYHYFSLMIIVGLFFSLLGDIFLKLKISKPDGSLNKYFVFAIISFSLTHIIYILAFNHFGTFKKIDLLVSLILSFIIISILNLNKNIDFKNMFLPIRMYSFLICLMTFDSIKLSFLLRFNIESCLLLLGAFLFILSDLVLCFILFSTSNKKYLSAINLITYYTGQFIIASSILFF